MQTHPVNGSAVGTAIVERRAGNALAVAVLPGRVWISLNDSDSCRS